VTVQEGIFAELRNHFSEQEVVEITATVSYSNPTFRWWGRRALARQENGICEHF